LFWGGPDHERIRPSFCDKPHTTAGLAHCHGGDHPVRDDKQLSPECRSASFCRPRPTPLTTVRDSWLPETTIGIRPVAPPVRGGESDRRWCGTQTTPRFVPKSMGILLRSGPSDRNCTREEAEPAAQIAIFHNAVRPTWNQFESTLCLFAQFNAVLKRSVALEGTSLQSH
jgi:hypothetical protein